MMKNPLNSAFINLRYGLAFAVVFALFALGCQALTNTAIPPTPTPIPEPTPIPTRLPPVPVSPGEENPDEPVFITGDIPYTSPFFINTIFEPFVLLEDQAGFASRDKEFIFRLEGQAIGPVEIHNDQRVSYSLALPSIPQGTQLDVDNDGKDEVGVQIFAVAYWSNTWGGPFLERRDGKGWSTSYVSTIVDPDREDEIVGGILVVWAPDDQQSFPTGFGEDGLLFTKDDPAAPIPSGYNLVDINQEPFSFYKEARPNITLSEGASAVNDFSTMSYADAFQAMIEKVERAYPFTREKNISWETLKDEYAARIADVSNDKDFYRVLHDFTQEIPDGHVGMQINGEIFFEDNGGSFGLNLSELSDGRVLVTNVIPNSPGERAGIRVGAELLTWEGKPISEAIDAVNPYFGPYSTQHNRRIGQVLFLTRVPPNTNVTVKFRNPGSNAEQEARMRADVDYDSLFAAIPELSKDELIIPVEGEILDESGLGYVRVNTFSADYSLIARLWEHFIKGLIDNEIPGLIIDLRVNSGGSGHLATDFAGYFFEEEITLYESLYYSEESNRFEASGLTSKIEPGPLFYAGQIAVLVGPDCVSACEGFAYALTQNGRSTVVGHYPSAGAYGEVGRGQYTLPGDIKMQFPTGRYVMPDGQLALEGVGVIPDVVVPVTEESALGEEDAVLEAAVSTLLESIK